MTSPKPPAEAYALASFAMAQLLDSILIDNNRSQIAYLFARAALLEISAVLGPERAAEMAYGLADEMATQK